MTEETRRQEKNTAEVTEWGAVNYSAEDDLAAETPARLLVLVRVQIPKGSECAKRRETAFHNV